MRIGILKNLGLELNKRSQLFKFEQDGVGRDIDFMGFRFFHDKTILRKSIMLKMCKKAKRINKKDKPTIYDLKQMMSYIGWINDADVYNVWLEYIKPNFDYKKSRKRISRYDKKLKKAQ